MISLPSWGRSTSITSRVDTDSLVQVMPPYRGKRSIRGRGSTTQYRGQGDGQADRHDWTASPRIVDQPPLVVHPPELLSDRPLVDRAVAAYTTSLREDVAMLLFAVSRPVDVGPTRSSGGKPSAPAASSSCSRRPNAPCSCKSKQAQRSVLEAILATQAPIKHPGQAHRPGQTHHAIGHRHLPRNRAARPRNITSTSGNSLTMKRIGRPSRRFHRQRSRVPRVCEEWANLAQHECAERNGQPR